MAFPLQIKRVMHVLKVFVLFLMPMLSFAAGEEVCMQPKKGKVYGCVQKDDPSSHAACKKSFGDGYMAYIPTDWCNLERAYKLADKKYTGQKVAASITPACYTFDQAVARNCQELEQETAYEYCSGSFGELYLPFFPSRSCSVREAEASAGFVDPAKMSEGIQEKLNEIDALLSLVDRNNFNALLEKRVSTQYVIDDNFATEVLPGILTKFSKLRNLLYQRSMLKIRFGVNQTQDEAINEFVGLLGIYINHLYRLKKIYLAVAHRNHLKVKTYNLDKLNFLNLKVNKSIGLEILLQGVYKVRNHKNDVIEFLMTEQEKMIAEYEVLSEPSTLSDYAKLVQFLGVRETLNNTWALTNLNPDLQINFSQRSCHGFLSFPEVQKYSDFAVVDENREFGFYYNVYLPRLEEIAPLLQVELLKEKDYDNFETIAKLDDQVLSYLKDKASYNGLSIQKQLKEDVSQLMTHASDDSKEFFSIYLAHIVGPGDDLLDADKLSKKLAEYIYERRVKAITNGFYGLYPYIGDKTADKVKIEIERFLAKRKLSFTNGIRRDLRDKFEEFYREEDRAEERKEEKIESIIAAAKPALLMSNYSVALDDDISENIAPATIKEMMILFEQTIAEKYQDIKLTLDHDEKMANILQAFFQEVTKEFNQEFLESSADGNMNIKESRKERSERLWQILIQHAAKIIKEKKFTISGKATVPHAIDLSRDRKELKKSPYMVSVYEDGQVVTQHIDDLYRSFADDIDLQIPLKDQRMRVLTTMGVPAVEEMGSRNHRDILVAGEFGMAEKLIQKKGEVRKISDTFEISETSLKRLYFQSLDLTKSELRRNLDEERKRKIENEHSLNNQYNDEVHDGILSSIKFMFNELKESTSLRIKGYSSTSIDNHFHRKYKKEREAHMKAKMIKTELDLFARVFEALDVPLAMIQMQNKGSYFSLSVDEQKKIVSQAMTEAYGKEPLLRSRLKIDRPVMKKIYIPPLHEVKTIEVTEKKERSLLQQLGLYAFDRETREFDEEKARELVVMTLTQAEDNIGDKLNSFCKADYKKLKNNESFRGVVGHTKFLRKNLKSELGTTITNATRIRLLDERLEKTVRSKKQAFNEDHLEPWLLGLGIGAMAIVLVTFGLPFLGISAPVLMGKITLGLMLSNYVFFPMVAVSTYTRINSQFIEVPAQLKFQKSLAASQIKSNRLTSYEHIDEVKKSNFYSQMMTIGLMPLDIWFGHSVVAQTKALIGTTGAKSFKNLTGVQFKAYSAPTKSIKNMSDHDAYLGKNPLKRMLRQAKVGMLKAKSKLPRYQMVPKEYLDGMSLLRVGLVRKLKAIGDKKAITKLIDAIDVYQGKLQGRVTKYDQFLAEEGRAIEKLRLNEGLSFMETFRFGLGKTAPFYYPKSAWKAIKEKRFIDYMRNFSQVVDELKTLQGELFRDKLLKLEKLTEKLAQFQRANSSSQNKLLVDDFIAQFDNEELMLLEEIVKKQKGDLKSLKKVYKDFTNVKEGIKQMSYLYSNADIPFHAPQTGALGFMDDSIDSRYIYQSETEDIVLFYESLVRQNPYGNHQTNKLRQALEKEISSLFYLDEAGKRVYR